MADWVSSGLPNQPNADTIPTVFNTYSRFRRDGRRGLIKRNARSLTKERIPKSSSSQHSGSTRSGSSGGFVVVTEATSETLLRWIRELQTRLDDVQELNTALQKHNISLQTLQENQHTKQLVEEQDRVKVQHAQEQEKEQEQLREHERTQLQRQQPHSTKRKREQEAESGMPVATLQAIIDSKDKIIRDLTTALEIEKSAHVANSKAQQEMIEKLKTELRSEAKQHGDLKILMLQHGFDR